MCVNLYTLLVLEISLPTMHRFDKKLAKCNTDHEDWQKLEKTYIMHLICNKRVMMALDCSLGKQMFLAWRKDIFKVFYIYIYLTLPFVGDLFFFSFGNTN